ncbi:carbamoyltransferase N-terminal domain-containing protein [Streptomyces chattanoogensis]|uniref:carbamoyltransferase N-terminal domain-containing protein n=1 Tax=Streptomyces chattanoogensis TaxID=66876 RepID=UPI0036CF40D3
MSIRDERRRSVIGWCSAPQRLGSELAPDLRSPNLCLSGGCALNIKWNSLIRNSGLFREVWIPPFPNGSGAAIGTAAAEMVRQEGRTALNWDVFRRLRLLPATDVPGWTWEPCAAAGLAKVLHEVAEPVVVLDGLAELGPRALGGRSILAPAADPRRRTGSTTSAVLMEYEQLSGVPVLCNTSANDQGCGFFPDVCAAARRGRVDLVWPDGHLYPRR